MTSLRPKIIILVCFFVCFQSRAVFAQNTGVSTLAPVLDAYSADASAVDKQDSEAIRKVSEKWIGRLSKALSEADENDPRFDKVVYELMALELAQQSYDKAIALSDLLISRKTPMVRHESLVMMRAEMLLSKARASGSKEDWAACDKAFSESVSMLSATDPSQIPNLVEVLAFMQKAASISSSNQNWDEAIWRLNLAIHFMNGGTPQARERLEKVLKRGPSSYSMTWFTNEVFKLRLQKGDKEEAMKMLTLLVAEILADPSAAKNYPPASLIEAFSNKFSESGIEYAKLSENFLPLLGPLPQQARLLQVSVARRLMNEGDFSSALKSLNVILKDSQFDLRDEDPSPDLVGSKTDVLKLYAACLSQLGFLAESNAILDVINKQKTTK